MLRMETCGAVTAVLVYELRYMHRENRNTEIPPANVDCVSALAGGILFSFYIDSIFTNAAFGSFARFEEPVGWFECIFIVSCRCFAFLAFFLCFFC